MAASPHAGDLLRVAVMGLGEAGREIAGDLAAHGHEVRGYDPAAGVADGRWHRAATPEGAVDGCDAVLVLVAAEVAHDVVASVSHVLAPGMVYADCCTADPRAKRTVASVVDGTGAAFVDAALLAPVPGRGLATPTLVSGNGAERFAKLFEPPGMPVEVVSAIPGDAAARKLLRSVFMKGMATALLEALEAAEAQDCGEWLRDNVAAELERADGALVERLVTGSKQHAPRRVEEMAAAENLLRELSADACVTRASKARLQRLAHAEDVGGSGRT